jgi:hypothetical protein
MKKREKYERLQNITAKQRNLQKEGMDLEKAQGNFSGKRLWNLRAKRKFSAGLVYRFQQITGGVFRCFQAVFC